MVVENARLYDDAQRRSRELGGLQQIAEAIGALRSPEQLYDQITRRVAELMDVELCGVLLYDPHTHVLVSQRPFYGLDDDETVSFYQLPSPPGSVIAELWQDRPMWTCNDLRRESAGGRHRPVADGWGGPALSDGAGAAGCARRAAAG